MVVRLFSEKGLSRKGLKKIAADKDVFAAHLILQKAQYDIIEILIMPYTEDRRLVKAAASIEWNYLKKFCRDKVSIEAVI